MVDKEMNRLLQNLRIVSVQYSIKERLLKVKMNHPSRVDLINDFEEELSYLLEIRATWEDMMNDLRFTSFQLNESLIKNYALSREIETLKSKVTALEKSNKELFEQL